MTAADKPRRDLGADCSCATFGGYDSLCVIHGAKATAPKTAADKPRADLVALLMTPSSFPPAGECSPEDLDAIADLVVSDPSASWDLAGSREHLEALCRRYQVLVQERDAARWADETRAKACEAAIAQRDVARQTAAAMERALADCSNDLDAARTEIRALQDTLAAERNERQGEVLAAEADRERADAAEALVEVHEAIARAALAIVTRTAPVDLAELVHAVEQYFNPMAELAKWRRWATSITGRDGFQADEEQRMAVERHVRDSRIQAQEALAVASGWVELEPRAVSKEDMATAIGTLERLARVLLPGRETWAPDEIVSAAATARQDVEELRGQVAPLEAQKQICALHIQIDEMREQREADLREAYLRGWIGGRNSLTVGDTGAGPALVEIDGVDAEACAAEYARSKAGG